MKTKKTTISHATLWAVTACVVLSLLFFSLYRFGPDVEDYFKPVFTDVKMTFIIANEDSAMLMLTGTKYRNCNLSSTSVEVYTHGIWVQGQGTMVDQEGNPIAIQNQRISVGAPFVRQVRVVPSGTAVKIRLEARCHPLWLTKQTLPVAIAQVQQDNSGVAQR